MSTFGLQAAHPGGLATMRRALNSGGGGGNATGHHTEVPASETSGLHGSPTHAATDEIFWEFWVGVPDGGGSSMWANGSVVLQPYVRARLARPIATSH